MPSFETIESRGPLSRVLYIAALIAPALLCPFLIYFGGKLGLLVLIGMAGLTIAVFTHPLVPFTIYFAALFFEDTTLPGLPVSINQIAAPVFFLSAFIYFLRGKTLSVQFQLLPLLTIVTLYFALNGLFGTDFENGILYARYALVYLVLSVCLAVSLSSERAIFALCWIIVVLTTCSAIDGLIEALDKNILGGFAGNWGIKFRIQGRAANPITFGWNLVYAFPFAFFLFAEMRSRYMRILAISLGSFILGIAALTFNRQTFVVIAVVVGLCVLLYTYKNRAALLSIVSGLLIVGAFTILPMIIKRMLTITSLSTDPSFRVRRDSFLIGMEMFKENPITGVGFGSFSKIWREYIPSDYTTYYAQYKAGATPKYMDLGMGAILVETGIVGLALFLLLTGVILWRAYSYRKAAIATGDRFARNLASTAIVIVLFYTATSFIQDTFLYTRIWIFYGVAMLLDVRQIPFRQTADEGLDDDPSTRNAVPDQ